MVSSDFTNDFHLIIHTLFLKGFRKVCEALFAIFKYLICKWKCWELLQDIDLCLNNNSKAPTSFNNWIINVQLHILFLHCTWAHWSVYVKNNDQN